MEIKNCAAIVTGGASGIGAATAIMLSEAGAKVAILDTNLTAAEEMARKVNGIAIHCDVSDEKSVEAAIQFAKKNHGPARICINCAGILYAKRILGINKPFPANEFRKVIEVNLMGTFFMMHHAAAQMVSLDPIGPSQERGVIINTSSIAAFDGQIGQAAYSASKGGVAALILPAARELAQFAVRVVAIAPGLIDTPILGNLSSEARESLINAIPFPKRMGYPEEFAKLTHHIIDNPLINGEIIRLDGGLRLP